MIKKTLIFFCCLMFPVGCFAKCLANCHVNSKSPPLITLDSPGEVVFVLVIFIFILIKKAVNYCEHSGERRVQRDKIKKFKAKNKEYKKKMAKEEAERKAKEKQGILFGFSDEKQKLATNAPKEKIGLVTKP